MKIKLLCLALIATCTGISSAQASDSCKSLLCLSGQLQGEIGISGCSEAIADYFNIVEFGRHGSFNPGKTANSRLDFLNSCSAPGMGDWVNRINNTYGSKRTGQ